MISGFQLTSARVFAVSATLVLGWGLFAGTALADIIDPAPHVEDEVNWTIGDMAADPVLNYVYIINETEHKLHALNTETGVVDVTVEVDGNTTGGFIGFSVDGSKVYVSCPLAARLHTFQAGTLASIEARTIGVAAASFVIGSDGYLYAVGADGYLAKINLANGVKVDSHSSPMPSFPADTNLIRRSTDGTGLFILKTNTANANGGGVTEFQVQANAMPSLAGTYFTTVRFAKDFAADPAGDRLYRAGGSSITGVRIWNLTAGTGGSVPPGDTWNYRAVTHRPGSAVVWAATDGTTNGYIRRINKATDLLEFEYRYVGGTTGFGEGRVFDRQIAVTPNGHVIYGKYDDLGGKKRYIGLIGQGTLTMPQAPPTPVPPLTHTEKEVKWKIGQVLGDPIRNLIYVVNETGKKVLAVNAETGAVDAEASLTDNVRYGHLGLSPDNGTIYLTTPLSRKVHAFTAGTLVHQWSRSLQFPAQDFVIGSDGYLYAMWTTDTAWWYMRQVDLTTGFTLREHTEEANRFSGTGSDLVQDNGLLERNGDGSRIFVFRGASAPVTEFAVTLNAMPARSGTHYAGGKSMVDLTVDHGRNTIFGAGSAPGLAVWNMTTRVEGLWGTESSRSESVAQAPGSDDVYAASDERIRHFTKTGKVQYDYLYRGGATGFIDEDIIDRTLQVSPSGHMLFGKQRWRGVTGIYVDGSQFYLSMIGPPSIQVPEGSTAPVYPNNVTASDGSSPDHVTISWSAVGGATSYTVYRGVGNPIVTIEEVGTTSATTFNDTTAVPAVAYRYRVVTNNAAGCSGFSDYDNGSRQLTLPDPPENVTATDQAHPDWVRVDWDLSLQATGYNVYRSEQNNPQLAERIVTGVTDTTYTDTTAMPFVTYYYWVTGTNTLGESQFSTTDTGQRGLLLPEAPSGVMASDELFTDKVLITWLASTLANTYKVYRSLTTNPVNAVEIGETDLLTLDDASAMHGLQYYYFVAGVNAAGTGPFSNPAEPGSRKVPPPAVPGNFEASDDLYTDKIVIFWDDVAADLYFLYKGLDPLVQGDFLTSTPETSFNDFSVSEGVFYYYMVRAWTAEGGYGALTAINAGRRTIIGPAWITATDGTWEDKVELEWEATDGLHSYEVYRGPSTDPAQAASIGTSLTNSLIDANAVAGTQYYYFVRSRRTEFQSDLVSPFSPHDAGHRATDAPYLPDALIGKKPTALKGNDVFSLFGVGQEIRQKSKKLKPLKWYVNLVNDGQLEDDISGTGTRSNRFFKVNYLQSQGGGPFANVSGAVMAGGLNRVVAASGETVRYQVLVKPSRKAKGRKKVHSCILVFKSTNRPSKGDGARATALTKK